MQYTQQDKANALETSLTHLASCMGYTPKKVGRCHTLKEMDSIRIYNDRTWYRWSNTGTRIGGTQIDFVLEFGNANSVPEAVHQLLNLQGISPEYRANKNTEYTSDRKEFKLPNRAESYRIAYAYLIKTRGLSKEIVDYFVKNKIMYEDKDFHNLVFVGRDAAGKIRYATKHGTRDAYGQKYKGDVAGNDKNYGVNIVNKDSDVLKVFEASIDCIGMTSLRKISSSELLQKSFFIKGDDIRNNYNNPVLVSFSAIDFTGTANGIIRRGDHINVSKLIDKNAITTSNTTAGTGISSDDNTASTDSSGAITAATENLIVEDAYVVDAFDSSGVKIEPSDTTSIATSFNIYIEKDDETAFYNSVNDKNIAVAKIELSKKDE